MELGGLYEGWSEGEDEWCMVEGGEEEWDDLDLDLPLPDIILGRIPKTEAGITPPWMALRRLEGKEIARGDPLGLERGEWVSRNSETWSSGVLFIFSNSRRHFFKNKQFCWSLRSRISGCEWRLLSKILEI